MVSKTSFNKEKRAPIDLTEDTATEEYKRVRYSLKMALRMVNADFASFTCSQINQAGLTHDINLDKTTV